MILEDDSPNSEGLIIAQFPAQIEETKGLMDPKNG